MRLVLALIIVSIGLSAFADETSPLKSLVEEAMEKNPEILRAKAEWEAATKRPSQAGSLPDPIVGVGWRNVRFDRITLTEDPNSMVTFSLSQEFPFPGKLSLREKVAQEEAQAQEKLYEASLRRVIADLKEAYYDWFLVDKSIEITFKNKDLLEKFLKVAEAKYAVGKGIQQDVLKAQVEVSRFIEKSPLLKLKENLINRQEEALKLAKREYYPDFALGVAPAVMGMESGGVEGAWEVTLGVKVPLYFSRKQRFGVQEAVSQLQAAREDYTSTNQSLFFNVKDQYLVAKTSENLL